MPSIFENPRLPKELINPAVEACLTEFGYSWEVAKDGDYRFHNAVKDGNRYRTQILVTDLGVVRLWTFVTDLPYPEHRKNWVRACAEALNAVVVWGAFIYQDETSAIIYRDAIQIFDAPTSHDIEVLLNRSATPLALWGQSYPLIVDDLCDGETAAMFAVIMQDCLDDESEMTDDHRRKLLSVAKGEGTGTGNENAPPLTLL
jgi:hypothetical protein